MAILKQIITLTAEQYEALINDGSITVNGVTYPYSENALYIVPEGDEDTFAVKTETTAAWRENASYVPAVGEIIIYSDKEIINGVNVPGIKIGDGITPVINLPFISAGSVTKLSHSLTFGANQAFTFDGSQDLTVPVYLGNLI